MREQWFYCLECGFGSTSDDMASQHEDENPDHLVLAEECDPLGLRRDYGRPGN